jgi:hypothetical protein
MDAARSQTVRRFHSYNLLGVRAIDIEDNCHFPIGKWINEGSHYMNSLFGGKSREERETERQQKQAQLQRQQTEAANQYDGMVTKALEQLTRWAFPDSQVERHGVGMWRLWHTTDDGKKYVDVAVMLQFDEDQPTSFLCDESLQSRIAELTREDLDDALRMCICSISG